MVRSADPDFCSKHIIYIVSTLFIFENKNVSVFLFKKKTGAKPSHIVYHIFILSYQNLYVQQNYPGLYADIYFTDKNI